jgi:hypothetical protein
VIAVTFFVTLPLMQVIVIFFTAGLAEAVGVAEGVGVGFGVSTTASCMNLTEILGDEKVKPLMESLTQPFFSLKSVVAIFELPSALVIETLARKGAVVNL